MYTVSACCFPVDTVNLCFLGLPNSLYLLCIFHVAMPRKDSSSSKVLHSFFCSLRGFVSVETEGLLEFMARTAVNAALSHP